MRNDKQRNFTPVVNKYFQIIASFISNVGIVVLEPLSLFTLLNLSTPNCSGPSHVMSLRVVFTCIRALKVVAKFKVSYMN